MAKARPKVTENETRSPLAARNLPETRLTGVNARNTKTVLVSAVLEVHGQVRFGDGTDVGLTITETDMVLCPSDGTQLQKFIFAGSKRRGVDRRTIHELRDQHWDGQSCYVPRLCCECPICWLYGFTGTTQDKNTNAKSRVLYASSVSVEEVQVGRNIHSRNQVNEKTQTTAGAAGIHEEEIIVAGVHFPTYTALVHTLDWEIGVFAHAFLENVNSNRYTAASRAQGGIRFSEHTFGRDGQRLNQPLIIVDESEEGIFPLATPKIAGWENEWKNAEITFCHACEADKLKAKLELQGFDVEVVDDSEGAQSGMAKTDGKPATKGGGEDEKEPAKPKLTLEKKEGIVVVKHDAHILMTRYIGAKALGYLRRKQLEAKKQLLSLDANAFRSDIASYMETISPKSSAAVMAPTAGSDETGGDLGNDENE